MQWVCKRLNKHKRTLMLTPYAPLCAQRFKHRKFPITNWIRLNHLLLVRCTSIWRKENNIKKLYIFFFCVWCITLAWHNAFNHKTYDFIVSTIKKMTLRCPVWCISISVNRFYILLLKHFDSFWIHLQSCYPFHSQYLNPMRCWTTKEQQKMCANEEKERERERQTKTTTAYEPSPDVRATLKTICIKRKLKAPWFPRQTHNNISSSIQRSNNITTTTHKVN